MTGLGHLAGLTGAEARARLGQYGPNVVARETAASPFRLLLGQFENPFVWLLLLAAVVAGSIGDVVDALAVGAIVVINALVGFFQEYRAERAVLALRALTAPHARVSRDGRMVDIPASDIVPGDLLLLDAGDVVGADGQVVEAHALLMNESLLTGESLPVEKRAEASPSAAALAERHDAVFMGTAVANGSGRAVVTATGMQTEIGKIAHLLATAGREETPLERRLAAVSRVLLALCLGIVAIVAALGLWRGFAVSEVFLSAVSLAVAAVPEGLPAVVTIALALGVQRMVSRHVLVRKLPAVETLGCATVICTDKTGTLTTGVMRVRELWGKDHEAIVGAGCACCDAELDAEGPGGTGDPTEVAILLAGVEYDLSREVIERENPRARTNPFDSERKRMSVFRADGVLYVKGALETILPLCTERPEGVLEANDQMATRGLRVLGVALGESEREEGLRLLGLVGIADPPRSEVIDAVAAARAAGIRTVMITGDHPATAHAIARELGILGAGDDSGEVVHARATPADKIAIVRRWKEQGEVVAMTGDGVNDAPALREAHIGIAMGKTGTEVSREASDMILADDNFASIVAAIAEGRGIFDNIRKTLVFLLTGNVGELALMLGASVLGLPLPLLPLHLLWINLVTDGLPALALVTDAAEPGVMTRTPRRPDEPMLARREWLFIVATGLLEAAVTLGVFVWALDGRGVNGARSLAFSTLVFAELLRAFAARSPDRLFWEVGPLTNLGLLAVVLLSALVQLGLHTIPWTQGVFETRALSPADLALVFSLGLIPVSVLELSKVLRRWGKARVPRNAGPVG